MSIAAQTTIIIFNYALLKIQVNRVKRKFPHFLRTPTNTDGGWVNNKQKKLYDKQDAPEIPEGILSRIESYVLFGVGVSPVVS